MASIRNHVSHVFLEKVSVLVCLQDCIKNNIVFLCICETVYINYWKIF